MYNHTAFGFIGELTAPGKKVRKKRAYTPAKNKSVVGVGVMHTMNGITQSIEDWCIDKDMSYSTFRRNVLEKDYSVSGALNKTVDTARRSVRA